MRIFVPLGLWALGVALPLVVLELALRLAAAPYADRYVYDPVLGHKRSANLRGSYDTSEFRTLIAFNSGGFHDRERKIPKARGSCRVAILGDSVVEAVQVELEKGLSSALEQRLNARGIPVEVLNFGVSGYGTAQEYLLLKTQVLEYQPDLVLLGFLPANDIRNNSMQLEQSSTDWRQATRPYLEVAADAERLHLPGPAEASPITSWRYCLLMQSRLASWLHARIRRTSAGIRILSGMGLLRRRVIAAGRSMPSDFELFLERPDERWELAWKTTARLVEMVKHELELRDITMALIVLPSREELGERYWQMQLDTYPAMRKLQWDVGGPNRRAMEMAAALGVSAVNLLPAFRSGAADNDSVIYPINGHYTARGHQIAAAEVEKHLLEKDLLARCRR